MPSQPLLWVLVNYGGKWCCFPNVAVWKERDFDNGTRCHQPEIIKNATDTTELERVSFTINGL